MEDSLSIYEVTLTLRMAAAMPEDAAAAAETIARAVIGETLTAPDGEGGVRPVVLTHVISVRVKEG